MRLETRSSMPINGLDLSLAESSELSQMDLGRKVPEIINAFRDKLPDEEGNPNKDLYGEYCDNYADGNIKWIVDFKDVNLSIRKTTKIGDCERREETLFIHNSIKPDSKTYLIYRIHALNDTGNWIDETDRNTDHAIDQAYKIIGEAPLKLIKSLQNGHGLALS